MSITHPPEKITVASTGTCPSEWRTWWAAEAARVGSDWAGVLKLHRDVFDHALIVLGASS
jgi:hypothetical protein